MNIGQLSWSGAMVLAHWTLQILLLFSHTSPGHVLLGCLSNCLRSSENLGFNLLSNTWAVLNKTQTTTRHTPGVSPSDRQGWAALLVTLRESGGSARRQISSLCSSPCQQHAGSRAIHGSGEKEMFMGTVLHVDSGQSNRFPQSGGAEGYYGTPGTRDPPLLTELQNILGEKNLIFINMNY